MKLNSIQFLRALAAILVVYEHSMIVQINYASSWQQNFYNLNHFGCIGVDLFFVISGFIITFIAKKYIGMGEGLYFLAKRFCRINPVYYLASLLSLAVTWLLLQVNNIPFSNSLNKTISSAIDSLLVLPTSSDINFFSPLLNVGWTLSFEWLFYLLFSLLIICNIQRKTFFLSAVILILILFGRLLKPDDLRLIFLTNPIMLEFILGIIICQLYLKNIKISVPIGITILSIGVISYMLLIRFGFGNVWHHLAVIGGTHSFKRFLLWGVPSSCIVAGCVFLEKNAKLNRLFDNKWALLLGDASYSIYLIHIILFNLFMLLYQKTAFPLPADAMLWLHVIVAVAIAVAFYKIVEKPLLQRMHRSTLWKTTDNYKKPLISYPSLEGKDASG